MTDDAASSDAQSATPASGAVSATNNDATRVERRHAGLSAWGNFFVAVMTVFTAAATSYVAVVTYQDQRENDAESRKSAAADFAQRVEFLPGRQGSMTLDNPNDYPISDVVLLALFFDPKVKRDGEYFLVSTESMILPACSKITIPETYKWTFDRKTEVTLKQRMAYFEDRSGQAWTANEAYAFQMSERVAWQEYQESGMYKQAGELFQFHVFVNPMNMSVGKSARCK